MASSVGFSHTHCFLYFHKPNSLHYSDYCIHLAAAPKEFSTHHGKDFKGETDKQHRHKEKKSTSQKTVGGKSSMNELPSSPTRSRSDRAAHCGAVLLNPTDVDDPALSAVNPSFSEINYDVACPGAAIACANAIGDNILLDKTVGTKGIDVNPSLSEINYDVASPGAALAQANAIGHNILCKPNF